MSCPVCLVGSELCHVRDPSTFDSSEGNRKGHTQLGLFSITADGCPVTKVRRRGANHLRSKIALRPRTIVTIRSQVLESFSLCFSP